MCPSPRAGCTPPPEVAINQPRSAAAGPVVRLSSAAAASRWRDGPRTPNFVTYWTRSRGPGPPATGHGQQGTSSPRPGNMPNLPSAVCVQEMSVMLRRRGVSKADSNVRGLLRQERSELCISNPLDANARMRTVVKSKRGDSMLPRPSRGDWYCRIYLLRAASSFSAMQKGLVPLPMR